MIKVLEIIRFEGAHINIIKAIKDKPTGNINLNEEKLETIPLRNQEPNRAVHCPHFFSI